MYCEDFKWSLNNKLKCGKELDWLVSYSINM